MFFLENCYKRYSYREKRLDPDVKSILSSLENGKLHEDRKKGIETRKQLAEIFLNTTTEENQPNKTTKEKKPNS
jgi:hypothetical protein